VCPGIGLPGGLRSDAERTLGVELGSVRLQGAGPLAGLASAHGADAGASGNTIAFARGLPELGTPAGRFAVGHELAHVAQQRARTETTPSDAAADRLEERADAVGRELSGLSRARSRRVRPPAVALAGTPVQFGAFETIGSGARAVNDFLSPVTGPLTSGLYSIEAFLSQIRGDAPALVQSFVFNLGPRVLRWLLDTFQAGLAYEQWKIETINLLLNWQGVGALWAHIVDGVLLQVANIGEFVIHALETFGVGDFLTFLWSTGGRLRGIMPLTGSQIAASQEVHPPGLIPYWLVRVDHESLIARLSVLFSGHGTVFSQIFGTGAAQYRAVTTMHMIHVGTTMDDALAVHELTHVAQYELVGAMYMPEALHAQLAGLGYDYNNNPHGSLAAAVTAGATFADFNREQQAQICEDYYKEKHGLGARYGGALADLEYFVNDFAGRAVVPGLRLVVPQ
jgi:hypothetical protein